MKYKSREFYKKECDKLLFEKNDMQKRLNETETRKRLAGQYIQILRLTPVYTGNKGNIQDIDFDRLTRLLEVDDFPENL